MNLLAIFIDNMAVFTTFVLMTFVLIRTIKRTRKVVRIEKQTEEERKAQEIAQWLAAIKHDSTRR